MLSSLADAAPGQQQWASGGVYVFVVPENVYDLSGVVVAPGTSGNGGGLHWRNSISVVPGEVLTIIVHFSDALAGSFNTDAAVKRGETYLLRASGAAPFYSTLGGYGGYGGAGARNNPDRGAGGAGGYLGAGGRGATPGNDDTPPEPNSGGGIGTTPYRDGGGVGLQGRTADYAPGSRGTPKCGGGVGEGQSGGNGGVRLMWGVGRSYPDNAVDV